MARSETSSAGLTTMRTDASARPDRGERRLRRISAWLMFIFLLQGQLGAIWDREWHYYVGRDQFWTPPHTLIYSCVTGAGLIALTVILTDTIRYYRHAPGVDDTSTVRIFYIFHAPLGFIIAGFGALQALVAAPLDNYWHTLYGIDIALWAPFHMMGVTGAMIGALGMVYIFASEATIERVSGYLYRRFLGLGVLEWGVLFLIAGIINFTFIGFLQFPVATFGPFHIPTYTIPMALAGGLGLVSVVRFTQRPGTALLMVCLLAFHTFLEGIFVPWAIRTAVVQQGLFYRVPEVPYFNVVDALLPVIFIIPALIVDSVALWRLRRGLDLAGSLRHSWIIGIIITIPELIVAPCLLLTTFNLPQVLLEQPGIDIPPDIKVQAALIAIPVFLIAGGIGTLLGANFGDVWRWNKS
ncbi:MAG TPA: hypothetical protein VNG51_21745 [Ktedonobacteraceae bacterium]|nr:hypothetical protein [Ktedonobacteraceae bacterium]